MDTLEIYTSTTAHTITLFWDKPKDAIPHETYTIYMDGSVEGQTDKTHFTVAGLQPDRDYEILVLRDGWEAARCKVRTQRKRRRIVVSAPPFGAIGDGRAMDTAALQAAIDACGPDEEVYLPEGTYLTGALTLHSDMALHLEKGAVLQGSTRPEHYTPRIPSRFEGIERMCYQSLLNLGVLDHASAPNCRNVLIYGQGIIRGGGRALAEQTIEQESAALRGYLAMNPNLVAACENERTIPGRVRGRLINLSNCENVRITGLTLQNGPSWNVHMIYSRHILTDHCTICSQGVWNGDGWDPDSSEDCTLFACHFATGDDMVAIKSGKNPEGNEIGRPTRNIRVFDCDSECGHGIAIGSEISGGIENVAIWDCDIACSDHGIEIKGTPKRGGYVRNVSVRDCVAPRVRIHPVRYNDDGLPAPNPPVFESFKMERLHLTGKCQTREGWEAVTPLEIEGFDTGAYAIRDVGVKEVALPSTATLKLTNCRRITLENIGSRGITE